MRQIILTSLIFFSFAVSANTEDPEKMLRQAASSMTQILDSNPSRIKEDTSFAEQVVRENLLPLIDTQGIGRRLLTTKQWGQLSDDQQKRFNDAFINHLIKTYSSGLSNYDGHRFVFKKTQYNHNRRTAWVNSDIISQDNETFNVLYTLKKSGNYQGWRVVDISVNGIKVLQNYREQLKTVDLTQGFDELILKIEQASDETDKK
ncbi:MAG: ABC transporter substrate-binding protein [Gammaproteobacteria bacterium]|nr:ABC transporter substrate-binding protein [Gammaproteobacteria bacterium]